MIFVKLNGNSASFGPKFDESLHIARPLINEMKYIYISGHRVHSSLRRITRVLVIKLLFTADLLFVLLTWPCNLFYSHELHCPKEYVASLIGLYKNIIITRQVPLNIQSLHDTVSCFVFTTESLGCIKTKHLGIFLVRVK